VCGRSVGNLLGDTFCRLYGPGRPCTTPECVNGDDDEPETI